MNITRYISIFLIAMTSMLSSCQLVEGIFKAGMGFGIFIVVAIIGLILFLIFRMGRSKKP
jgi:dipeptide/tripeptide permease